MFFVMVASRAIQHGLGMVKFWTYHLYLQLNFNILMYILRIAWKTWFMILEKVVSTKHMCMIHWKMIQSQNCIPIVQVFGLSIILRLFNIKARNGWTDKSFTELLELLHEILPRGNTLLTSHYEAKKILCPMGMKYRKIHAFPNDCILYRKEFEGLHKYLKCGVSRYKVKDDDSDEDVLWYLPIIPWLRRFFANVKDAKNLTWHENGRRCDGLLQHVVDSPQWKKIDGLYLEFRSDTRNLRFGLATDGMIPYDNLSSKHSSWSILLIIYNLSY